MRLNVNGAKIWSRGANLIPMDEMDGRLTEDA
jgi:beta-galactosidase/beta-glucuronidase